MQDLGINTSEAGNPGLFRKQSGNAGGGTYGIL